jgi:HD-like signal output (HDOD) protein
MTPQTLAAEVETLFALPDAVLRVHNLLGDPNANAHDISAAVELDPSLAAGVLHLANSPLYGQHGKVDTVARAITLIGLRALREMVLATSVVKVFADIPEEFVDMASFWDNSITCGVVAQLLARQIHAHDADSLFLAELLHGVGRLVLYARRAEPYRALLAGKPQGDRAMAAAEQSAFGFTHAQLGAALLRGWNLPERICMAIEHQIEPELAPAAHIREVAILHIADDITASLAPCLKQRQPATPYSPGFDPGAGEILGITNEDLEAIRLEALSQTFDIIEIINPGSTLIF